MMNSKRKTILILLVVLLVTIGGIYFYKSSNYSGVLKEYNSKGVLVGSNEYVIKNGDTILHGQFISYNTHGIKISEGNYVNGYIKGKCIYYYDNGKIETIQYRKKNKIKEETTEYYPNGKVKKYIMSDPFGLEAFIARYDEQGIIKSYEGYPLMEIYQYPIAHKERFKVKINQYLKVGDILKYRYLIANIPDVKRSFKIENISIGNSKVKRTLKYIIPTQINVEEVLIKKGKNVIRAVVKYAFDDKIIQPLNDTISFDVYVN